MDVQVGSLHPLLLVSLRWSAAHVHRRLTCLRRICSSVSTKHPTRRTWVPFAETCKYKHPTRRTWVPFDEPCNEAMVREISVDKDQCGGCPWARAGPLTSCIESCNGMRVDSE
ncbi:hypothetical protein B0H34DRAFT_192413 [Crassisporium funariophilum]|nr:hypothetical protein B0H34DRAFT_192413 [Crassisporium funariophilum]